MEAEQEVATSAAASNAGGWAEGMKSWKTVDVSLRLNRIGFKLSRGGGNKSVSELMNFEMNGIGTDIALFVDGSMNVSSFLHSIILEDTRENSKNIHRRLIAPTTTSEKENQIDLRYDARPATSKLSASSVISVIMFAPRFVLLPDVFADIFTFSMGLLSEFQKRLPQQTQITAPVSSEAATTETVPEVAPTASTMEVKVVLRSPEIVAMEDSTAAGM